MASLSGTQKSAARCFYNAIAGPSTRPRGATSVPRRILATPRNPRYTFIRHNSSTSASKPSIHPPAIPHSSPAFEELAAALSSSQPCFGARGDEITLMDSPTAFYDALIDMISRAKRRIIISSLYIGAEESELVDAIRTALESRPQLRVTFILDYHRATRLSTSQDHPPSTAHLLLPLLQKYSDRCEVWLFRSPKLRGLMEKIVPERFDEGWGTWHAKWYGVDDEVIISGANLAGSYFTNRQDRYIHFKSHPTLLSYLSSLTRLFTHYSYLLSASPPPSISRHHLVPLPSPKGSTNFFGTAALVWPTPSIHPRSFSAHALATLTAFQNSWRAGNPARLRRVDVDTWFWPVIQAGVLGIKEEEAALGKVFNAVRRVYEVPHPAVMEEESQSEEGVTRQPPTPVETDKVTVDLTSGYFGLYKAYKRAVIDSPAPVRVIAASPKANGFFGSAGLSRLIPEGYTLLESRFWNEAQKRGRAYRAATGTGVRLKEWEKEGWTYHSKGLWLSPTLKPRQPFMTFIGSSNLSTRSLELDTELSMILTTSSPSLRRALASEIKNLDQDAKDVNGDTWKKEERKVSLFAKVLIALGIDKML